MNILIKVDSKNINFNTKRYSYHNILDCHLKLKSILIYIITLYIYILTMSQICSNSTQKLLQSKIKDKKERKSLLEAQNSSKFSDKFPQVNTHTHTKQSVIQYGKFVLYVVDDYLHIPCLAQRKFCRVALTNILYPIVLYQCIETDWLFLTFYA